MRFSPYIKLMKTDSFSVWVRRAFLLAAALAIPAVTWAGAGQTSGNVSTELAKNLLCNTAALLQGDIGLLIGLILVFMGLWSLIQGNKIISALPLLIIGALITALPTLVMSAAMGLGDLLSATEISKSNTSKFISDAFTGAEAICPVPTAMSNERHQTGEIVPRSPSTYVDPYDCDGPSAPYLTDCK